MKTQTSKLPDGGGVSVTGHWALGCDLAQAEGLLALDLSPELQHGPSRAPSAAHARGKGNGNLKMAPSQVPYCQGQI